MEYKKTLYFGWSKFDQEAPAYVEAWYDRYEKLWTVQLKTAEGYGPWSAEHEYTKDKAFDIASYAAKAHGVPVRHTHPNGRLIREYHAG